MNTFKKKSLHVAVLAGLGALGAAGTADAVHINPDGLGQVLLFPYYTTRSVGSNAYNSLISIVNTSTTSKIVKVRFLEGKASREVLDFNLFLSPDDIWTGAIIPTPDGAQIATNDNSCVAPSDLFTRAPGVLEAFKNFAYTITPWSAAGVSLDRTREGYVEVLEMATVTLPQVIGYLTHSQTTGIPANCAALDALDANVNNVGTVKFPNVGTAMTSPPTGGLSGRMSIINAAVGTNFSYDATALDAWTNAIQYTEAGNILPNLGSPTDATGRTSNVFVNGGVVSTVWASTADSVSASMMRDAVINEFILDTATGSSTDWVVTFPTKNLYIGVLGPAVGSPFQNAFVATGSCDPYGVAIFDREEKVPAGATTQILPSPAPPIGVIPGSNLCWEANVVPFQAASLLASTNTNPLVAQIQAFATGARTTAGTRTSVASGTQQGPNGFFYMSFADRTKQKLQPLAGTVTFNGAAVAGVGGASAVVPLTIGAHYGLPVIGFAVHNYTRAGVVSNYGGVLNHKYTRLIPTT